MDVTVNGTTHQGADEPDATAVQLLCGGSSRTVRRRWRGHAPAVAVLLTLPMVLGLPAATTVSGRMVSAHGRWKGHVAVGCGLVAASFAALATVRADTSLFAVAGYLLAGGAGVGMSAQTLVLVAQNAAPASHLGAVSSLAGPARGLGGVPGLTALGAAVSARVGAPTGAAATASGLRAAYGLGLADAFAPALPFALTALIAVLFLRGTPLRTGREG
ncbi:hypothetical protein [Streptomyces sp. NPDC090022]|uniref:hypothetical protein n=1 Tax=Streptomyces sp. NPDC090022 TaxID=3365920 RepID=UPI00380706D2